MVVREGWQCRRATACDASPAMPWPIASSPCASTLACHCGVSTKKAARNCCLMLRRVCSSACGCSVSHCSARSASITSSGGKVPYSSPMAVISVCAHSSSRQNRSCPRARPRSNCRPAHASAACGHRRSTSGWRARSRRSRPGRCARRSPRGRAPCAGRSSPSGPRWPGAGAAACGTPGCSSSAHRRRRTARRGRLLPARHGGLKVLHAASVDHLVESTLVGCIRRPHLGQQQMLHLGVGLVHRQRLREVLEVAVEIDVLLREAAPVRKP